MVFYYYKCNEPNIFHPGTAIKQQLLFVFVMQLLFIEHNLPINVLLCYTGMYTSVTKSSN